MRQAFKPEFVNRLDDIVVFAPLSTDDLGQIVELYIDRLARRLADRRLELAVTPDARTWLAERGYDPIYGARPLRRLMQHEIDDTLAKALLGGRDPRRRHRARGRRRRRRRAHGRAHEGVMLRLPSCRAPASRATSMSQFTLTSV